jgi:hypothetical protein
VKGWVTELRSLREEQIEGLNSSGFILLACINIEATTRKAMEMWILQFIEICLRILQMLVFESISNRHFKMTILLNLTVFDPFSLFSRLAILKAHPKYAIVNFHI